MRSVIVERDPRGRFRRIADWFAPPALWSHDADRERRARLLVFLTGFVALWASGNALFQAVMGNAPGAGVSTIAAVFAIAAPLVLRRFRSVHLGMAVLASGLFISASVPNLLTGGAVSGPMFLLALIAALATLVAGTGHGLVWAVLAIVEIAVVQFLPHDDTTALISGPLTAGRARFAQPLLSVAIFMGLALIYEHLKRSTLQELERAQDDVRQSRDIRTEFVANVSHELRTPLTGIIGLTDVLLEGTTAPEQQEHLRTIRRSADALLHLIGSVLDFSKLEAGRFDIVAEPFSPQQVSQDVVRLLEPAAQRAGLNLRLELEGPVPTQVVGDALRMRQVLLNLVGNGLKFTREGEVVVRLQAAEAVAGVVRLTISVRDTGPGIASTDLERVFQPFEQVDASSRRRQGGTGLGLSISRSIVELMGGELHVDSVLDRGSTFVFALDLPLPTGRPHSRSSGFYDVAIAATDRSASEFYASPSRRRTPSAAWKETDPGVRRVLVAEDQEINQFLIAHMLEGLGVACQFVDDGCAAIAASAEPGVALVLMDLQMPELDGIEATRAIRASGGGHARVPIVALTASAVPEICDRCAQAGFDHVIEKPIDREALAATLRTFAPQLLAASPAQASVLHA